MIEDSVRAVRFAWGWATRRSRIRTSEITVRWDQGTVPGTLFLPEGSSDGLPGWVVLHGITRPGREHASLVRFARALAGTPAAVLVPEIPEWRDLHLSPERSLPIIRSAIRVLDAREETAPGRIAVVGFSFGAPQAVIASTDPSLEGHLHGVVGFGGYADLPRTIRFFFTGEHEWKGTAHRTPPDPYGRWLVGANYLTMVRGHEDAEDVEDALWQLAAEAGERGVGSWDSCYDPLKEKLRRGIHPDRRRLFDLFAPPAADEPPEGPEVDDLVERLVDCLSRASPLLRPIPHLDRVTVPVRLIHGAGDRLIPFTESLRWKEAFPAGKDVEVDVTRLFEHSGGAEGGSVLGRARDAIQLLRILRRIMAMA